MLWLPSLLFSLREEGLRKTALWAWTRLFGREEYVVFVRKLVALHPPLAFPVDIKGAQVRAMRLEDIDEVARRMPFSLSRLPVSARRRALQDCWQESAVAWRGNQIVGAVWYADSVGPAHPWYNVVAPHLRLPARLTTGVFVIPGEEIGSWALIHAASQRLASLGVRSTVSTVRSDNKPSLLMARMHGGELVARVRIAYHFGRRRAVAQEVPPGTPLLSG